MCDPATAGHILSAMLLAFLGQATSRPDLDVASNPKDALEKATELVDQEKPDFAKATEMLVAILQTGPEVTPGPYKADTRPALPPAPKTMLEAMTGIDDVRLKAALLLADIGEEAEKPLAGLLQHKRTDVRFLACLALSSSEDHPVETYEAMQKLLKDKNPLIRRTVCLAFQDNTAPSDGALADIASLLADEDNDVALGAFATLVELDAHKHIPMVYIAKALTSDLVEDALIAAAAKGKDAKPLLPQIRAALASKSGFVRVRALRTLGWLARDLPEVIPDVVGRLEDKDGMVRAEAAAQLGGLAKLGQLGAAAEQALAALRRALQAEKAKGVRSDMEKAIKAISEKAGRVVPTRPAQDGPNHDE